MDYQFLPHTADIKFQAFGKTREDAFKNAAIAFTKIITEADVQPKEIRMVEAEGHDEKQLLMAWLEKIHILLTTEHFLLSRVQELEIIGNRLTATVEGDNSQEYKLEEDIKAVTYHEMEIKKDKQWTVQVVVDI